MFQQLFHPPVYMPHHQDIGHSRETVPFERARDDSSGWRLQATDRQGQFLRDKKCRRWQVSQSTVVREAMICLPPLTSEKTGFGWKYTRDWERAMRSLSFVYHKTFQCVPFLACRQEEHAHVLCAIWAMRENMGSKKGAGMWEAYVLCLHSHSNLSNKQRSSSTPNLQQPIGF